MKRFFGTKVGDNLVFDEGEAGHIRQVLRMKVGDEIIGCVNDEYDYFCTLTEIGKNRAVAKIDRRTKNLALPNKEIVLFLALPKREYFETIVTKSVELGVGRIIPFVSAFSVCKEFKRARLDQIVLTACKQCERSVLPKVEDVTKFEDMLKTLVGFDCVVFANEREEKGVNFVDLKLDTKNSIAVIVGCEGGFDKIEIDKIVGTGAFSVSLGKRILRCDTASVAMLSVINVLSGN